MNYLELSPQNMYLYYISQWKELFPWKKLQVCIDLIKEVSYDTFKKAM